MNEQMEQAKRDLAVAWQWVQENGIDWVKEHPVVTIIALLLLLIIVD